MVDRESAQAATGMVQDLASSLSTSEVSFKTKAKPRTFFLAVEVHCSPPYHLILINIADHHLRHCVHVYAWSRGVCERE